MNFTRLRKLSIGVGTWVTMRYNELFLFSQTDTFRLWVNYDWSVAVFVTTGPSQHNSISWVLSIQPKIRNIWLRNGQITKISLESLQNCLNSKWEPFNRKFLEENQTKQEFLVEIFENLVIARRSVLFSRNLQEISWIVKKKNPECLVKWKAPSYFTR